MRLEPATTPPVDNPTDADIAGAIRNPQNEFIILLDDRAENAYMQTGGGTNRLLTVEYRADLPMQHFQGVEDHAADKVIELFQAYNSGNQSYKTMIEWKEITESLSRNSRIPYVVVAIIVLVIIVLLAINYFGN